MSAPRNISLVLIPDYLTAGGLAIRYIFPSAKSFLLGGRISFSDPVDENDPDKDLQIDMLSELRSSGDLYTILKNWAQTNTEHSLMQSKNVINVLLVGIDAAGENSDAIMIASVNKEKNTITLSSVMRDSYTYMDTPVGEAAAKINAACVDIFHKVNDAARLFSLNYTFNIGLEVRALVKQNATRMAVGSIMSRNGSHNIGSHVLSALSHNTGIMPDDRVLYQYLQQRMDYTATVTTDFPNWTAPTRFAGNLMKTFFSQRHLLEHISESEGLGAYHFQGRNLADKQTAKIKLHLRIFSPPQNFPPPKEVADNAAENTTRNTIQKM